MIPFNASKGAERYYVKFMGDNGFYDNYNYLFVLSKVNYICHKLLHSPVNFAGYLATPMII